MIENYREELLGALNNTKFVSTKNTRMYILGTKKESKKLFHQLRKLAHYDR